MFSEVILQRFLIFEKTTIFQVKEFRQILFFIEVVMLYLFIEVVRLCPSGLLLFPGNETEWPMFCQNVDSFLFRQFLGSRFVHFLAKFMPKFSVNFGMTCATN